MRNQRVAFFSVCVALASLMSGFLFGQRSVSAPAVSERTLARAFGTNGGQMGGDSSSYSCDDVNATNAGQLTSDGCAAQTAATLPSNATCVDCTGVNGSGYRQGNVTNIVLVGNFDCTGNIPNGSQLKTAICDISPASGFGTCGNFIPSNTQNCTGNFNQYGVQPVQVTIPLP
jgi:hypothetical protein